MPDIPPPPMMPVKRKLYLRSLDCHHRDALMAAGHADARLPYRRCLLSGASRQQHLELQELQKMLLGPIQLQPMVQHAHHAQWRS